MAVDNEMLKEAINDGIDAQAVNSTLGDIVDKANKKGKTPVQFKRVLETIVHMKKNTNNIPDKTYASNFVRENSEKIKAAINEGIHPSEIAATLMESTEKANDRRTKRRLKFITKFIIIMKRKELVLNMGNQKEMEKGRQKVLTNNTNK